MRRDVDHSGGRALLAHELVHVAQYDRIGITRFLWRYAREYVCNLWRMRGLRRAYEAISFEVEARVITAEWVQQRNASR